jgi:Family of unknown function (DUF6325)
MEAHEEEVGPVDIIVIGYPAGSPMTGEAADILVGLVDAGIVRILDAMFVAKDEAGEVSGFEAKGLDDKNVGSFEVFDGASSGMLGDEDIASAGEVLEPGEAAVILVYENRWAAPFAAAVMRNGGQLLASRRITVPEVLAALDAVEAAS